MTDDLDKHYKVNAHFDFDEYQPDKMDDLRTVGLEFKGTFRLHRMVPQGRFHYFFTYNGQSFYDSEQMTVSINERIQSEVDDKLQLENRMGIEFERFGLSYLNYINTLPMVRAKEMEEIAALKEEEEEEIELNPEAHKDEDESEDVGCIEDTDSEGAS